MKRVFAIAVVVALLAGCSDNKLTVVNYSDIEVFLNFQAEKHLLYGGDSIVVNDIPNGTYEYGTIYVVPSGRTITGGDGLDGQMTFERSETNIMMTYGLGAETDTTEVLWAVLSTDQPVGAITSP
ncbi:MAG: hypothetical protein GF331_23235 [Chitinivibrionales bacterium]|nr:hypothetical protein [Chitinivibrionales bacterium]